MKLTALLAPPDELQVEAGVRGELMVARIRIWIVLLLAPVPILKAIELPHWENRLSAGIVTCAALGAVLIYRAAASNPRRGWLGMVSTAFDVTLISASLGLFVLLGEPLTATNSLVLFGAYYLAIMVTGLRHDPRLSLLAGLLAVLEYTLVVIAAVVAFDLLEGDVTSRRYGSFSWGSQVSRVILLGTAAALATIIVLRQVELLRRSSIDALTSLYNRGAFAERFDTEATRSRRHKHPLSIAMIDIDHFKYINDRFGHAAGDEALVEFAQALRTEFRKTDLVARYGGEEFIVMMPETPPEAATAKLERFTSYISERTFMLSRRGEELRMTVSAGVAGIPSDVDDPAKLVGLADARLIAAKRAGRNSVLGAGVAVTELE